MPYPNSLNDYGGGAVADQNANDLADVLEPVLDVRYVAKDAAISDSDAAIAAAVADNGSATDAAIDAKWAPLAGATFTGDVAVSAAVNPTVTILDDTGSGNAYLIQGAGVYKNRWQTISDGRIFWTSSDDDFVSNTQLIAYASAGDRLTLAGTGSILDLDGASSVTVPDATADGEAIAYDQINWQLGTGGLVTDPNAYIDIQNTGGTANQQIGRIRSTGNQLRISRVDDDRTSNVVNAFTMDLSDGAINMGIAPSVAVPAATAANHAAQVSAIDASTGQLQIGGYEVGDTGWRDISGLLVNGWIVKGGGVGGFVLRRSGDVVTLQGRLDGASMTSVTIVSAIPAGFRTKGATPTPVSQSWSTGTTSNVATMLSASVNLNSATTGTTDAQFSLTWHTDDAWPSTLPGSAA